MWTEHPEIIRARSVPVTGGAMQRVVPYPMEKRKDHFLYAHWELDQAEYTVRHWKQKADGIASTHDDKNYELAETETKKAQIGSKVTPAVKTYTGFDSPKTQTKAVTADGKMVIDYYYERHLYNVTLNAGTGIEKNDRRRIVPLWTERYHRCGSKRRLSLVKLERKL